jgi:hypothetical protein
MDDRYIREPFVDLGHGLFPIGPRATWAGADIDKDLLALGVPAGAVNAAKAWIDDVDHRGGLLFPNVFRRPHDVAKFSELFVPDGLAVLGVALAADQVDRFLGEQRAEIGQEDGIVTMLREGAPLTRGFRALGYEPVVVHHGGLSCSWTCNSLQEEVAAATGIVPNEYGFIDSAEQADAVVAYLADPAVAKEDGIRRAWLIVRYDADRYEALSPVSRSRRRSTPVASAYLSDGGPILARREAPYGRLVTGREHRSGPATVPESSPHLRGRLGRTLPRATSVPYSCGWRNCTLGQGQTKTPNIGVQLLCRIGTSVWLASFAELLQPLL